MADEKEEPRIGVYICHCGHNIASVLDVKKLAEFAKQNPNVATAKDYLYMCSSLGQEMIGGDIAEHNLNRVLIAACTPTLHEKTFRETLQSAGLNPYLLEQANVREHVAWVHTHEREKAQKKARSLIRMGLAKSALLEPLEPKEMDVEPKAVIIGGGLAGMRSALDLARRGFEVHILELSPSIGGGVALSDTVDKGVSSQEQVSSLMDEVLKEPKITIDTLANIKGFEGFIGNFNLRYQLKPRHVKEGCTACLKCMEVCPVDTENEYDYSLSKRKAIYLPFDFAYPKIPVIDMKTCTKCGECVKTCPEGVIDLEEKAKDREGKFGMIVIATGSHPYQPKDGEFGFGRTDKVVTIQQLERLLGGRSPSKLEIKDGNDQNIVFIGCVGSRQKKKSDEDEVNEYCSRVCCIRAIKNALILKEKYPNANIFYLFRDIRTYGRYEYLYRDALEKNIIFMQYDEDNPPVVDADKGLKVTVKDVLSKKEFKINSNLVVLANGREPSESTKHVQMVLKITASPDKFLQEAHIKLRPQESGTAGIYLSGASQAPKNVLEALESASAASAKAAILLSRGKVTLDPIKAVVTEYCDGCAICIEPCLGQAISLIEYERDKEIKKKVVVNEALCIGCGVCMATCPKNGIILSGFTLDQLQAMVDVAMVGD